VPIAPALRFLTCLLAAVCAAPAWALDPDILINDQARQQAVAPLCRALVVQSSEGTPEHTYQKGLCLLYGLQTPKQMPLALALLRQAAGSGWVEAQLALADTLQQSNDADQREAMRWYGTAAAAGDIRASGRLARLTQRRNALEAAKAESAPAPQGSDLSQPGSGEDLPFKPQGYHCHISGFGKKFCHSAMD
jgi:TPR repeat protein